MDVQIKMREKFPNEIDAEMDISYDPISGRLNVTKMGDENENKDKDKSNSSEEKSGGLFGGLFSNQSEDEKKKQDGDKEQKKKPEVIVVKSEQELAEEAAMDAMKKTIEELESDVRASRRKISALTLDNENKERKIGELQEKQQ